jgi:hypothetical protein
MQPIVAHKSKGFWKVLPNQRQFFDDLAKELNIQRSDDWAQIKVSQVLQKKGGIGVLAHYGGSLFKGNYCDYCLKA